MSPRLRQEGAESLSPAWRYLLETGLMPPAALRTEDDDVVALFRAWGSGTRTAAPRWYAWRSVILRDWTDGDRPGPCWGEWVFDLALDAKTFYRLDEAGRERVAARRRRELAR
jgi:hypothetical protein